MRWSISLIAQEAVPEALLSLKPEYIIAAGHLGDEKALRAELKSLAALTLAPEVKFLLIAPSTFSSVSHHVAKLVATLGQSFRQGSK